MIKYNAMRKHLPKTTCCIKRRKSGMVNQEENTYSAPKRSRTISGEWNPVKLPAVEKGQLTGAVPFDRET